MAEFSFIPWSKVDKSKLPASSFLIVGDRNKKSTWHLPYKDETGKVNVGALRAIMQIIKNRKFRGRKITFSIPADAAKKAKSLWDEYQKKKQQGAFEEIEFDEAALVEDAIESYEVEMTDGTNLTDKILNGANGERKSENVYFVTLPISEAEVNDDRTAELTILESGWSKNKNYYSAEVVEGLIPHLLQRKKMYADHVYDKKKAFNRSINEWVATIQSAHVVHENGKAKAKAVVKFTHMPIGEALYRQAKDTPNEVGVSINAMVAGKRGKVEEQEGFVVEQWLLLFSPDFVSYPSAGGKVDKTIGESVNEEREIAWMVSEGLGEHCIWEGDNGRGASATDTNDVRTAENEAIELYEALKSLDEYIASTKINEYISDLYWAFRDLLRKIVESSDLEAEEKKTRIGTLIDEFYVKLKQIDFSGLIEDNNAATKEGSEMELTLEKLKTEFKEIYDAAVNEVVEGKKLVSQEEFEKMQKEVEALRKEKAARRQAEIFDEVIQEANVPRDLIGEKVATTILAGLSYDPEKENEFKEAVKTRVEEHAEYLKKVVQEATKLLKKNSDSGKKTEKKSALESFFAITDGVDNDGKKKVVVEDIAKMFNRN